MKTPFLNRSSLCIVAVYAGFSLAWIWFSDRLLLELVSDPEWLTQLQIYKGGVFVTCSSILLYALMRIVNARRDQTQAALEESRRRLSTLIGNLPGLVYRCRNDEAWTVEYLSDGVLGLSGRALSELKSLRHNLRDLIHPDDQQWVWEDVQAALRNKRRYAQVYRMITAGGQEKWVWEQGCGVYDAEGNAIALEGFITDITEQRRVEEEVRAGNERLKTLSQRLIEVQEAERRHLARELHDEIGQALTAAKMNLQALQRFPDPASFTERLQRAVELMDQLIHEVRNLSLNLRPQMLDDLGLVACLRWLLDQRVQNTGLKVSFVTEEFDERLDPAVETACFRVAQEALTNVIRHARARQVIVELARDKDVLRLTVRDDGAGFRPGNRRPAASHSGLGLLGMEERVSLLGGTLKIVSNPGHGTEVKASFPLSRAAASIRDTTVPLASIETPRMDRNQMTR